MTNGWISQQRKIANRATGTMPSAAVLDKIADRAISGGYKIGKSNMCPGCFVARSANGSCSCD